MKRLTVAHVQQIHSLMIAETGGLDGLRDAALLEFAVNAPFLTFDGQPLYRSLEAKAARLACSLVNNNATSTATNAAAFWPCCCFWS